MKRDFSSPRVVEIAENAVVGDLESYLSKLDVDLRRSASAYVFRLTLHQIAALNIDDARQALVQLIRKSAGVPLFALSLEEGAPILFGITASGLSKIDDVEDDLKKLREFTMQSVVREAKDLCFIRALPTEHFVAPSGKHCDTFFRLGDAVRSRAAMDCLAFWTASLLRDVGAVVVDTWSIASVVLRAMQLLGRTIPFDCLSSHPQYMLRDARSVISNSIDLTLQNSGDSLLFLLSATSSGTYATAVSEIAQEILEPSRIKITAIFGFSGGEAVVDRLCTIEFSPNNFSPDDCPFCKEGRTKVPLDPELYYLKAFEEKAIILGEKHAAQRGFIDRYGAYRGAFFVHRDDPFKRHHAFYIDVGALLSSSDEFRRKSEAAIDQLRDEIDLIVTPDTGASFLGELAENRLGVKRVVGDSLRKLSDADRMLLKKSARIALIDDVLDSRAARMEDYVRSLRELNSGLSSVRILIALARPASEQILARHRSAWTKNVPWKADLHAVEQFFLPDWSSADCPWCMEQSFLSRAVEKLAKPPNWILTRIGDLSARSPRNESINPLFLLPGVVERILGGGSVFADAESGALPVVFSVAASLQQLRNDKSDSERLVPGFSRYQVFAARNLGLYSETMLRAIILRTVTRPEWGFNERELLSQVLRSACEKSEDADYLAGEMLLAVSRGAPDASVISALDSASNEVRREARVLAEFLVSARTLDSQPQSPKPSSEHTDIVRTTE